jgi:hypothetical protein
MRNAIRAIATMLFAVAPATSFALPPQPLRFLPGQTLLACPAKTTAPTQPGVVCTRNVIVGGGEVLSGYTFSVKTGTTLPKGVFLLPLTGVLTMQSKTAALPPAGYSKKFQITASDGSRQVSGSWTFTVQNAGVCGCPVFTVLIGPMPAARAHQPYAATLGITGPPSNQILRPNYSWKLRAGSKLPPGLVLDQARGVVRGTPTAGASGNTYTFYVDVKETRTGQNALSLQPYLLTVQ